MNHTGVSGGQIITNNKAETPHPPHQEGKTAPEDRNWPLGGATVSPTCTLPWARVMMSMLSPFCLYSRMQALYLAVRMNNKSLLSPCQSKAVS